MLLDEPQPQPHHQNHIDSEQQALHKQAIKLHTSCNIGTYTSAKLLKHFGGIAQIYAAPPEQIAKILSAKQLQAFNNHNFNVDTYFKKHLQFLAQDPEHHHFITWDDPRYPQTLKQTDDAPVFLYIQGNLDILAQPAIAIVGSRNADERGLKSTHEFSTRLAEHGFCIVSGFAQGVDGMAHLAALEAGQATIAVLGAGLQIDYPKAHNHLRQAFNPENTCIISEFLLDAQPLEYHFPRRNRTIAALSAGVLVTQAELKSGSLITARLANELGRDVFALPYGLEQNGQGCNHLIQQGAKLVLTEQCILEEYHYLLQSYDFQKFKVNNTTNTYRAGGQKTPHHAAFDLNGTLDATPLSVAASKKQPPLVQPSKQMPKFEAQNEMQQYILEHIAQRAYHFDELLESAGNRFKHDDLQSELFILELEQVIERREGGFYHLL